jgi:hypothetical protein
MAGFVDWFFHDNRLFFTGFLGGVITYTRDGFSDSHCVQRTMTPNVASIQPGAIKLSKRTLLLEWWCCSWSVCLLLPFLPIIILCVCGCF